jgi:hypothetical protein
VNTRAKEKALRFAELYGASASTISKMEKEIYHIQMHSNEHGYAFNLCSGAFLARDLTPRAGESQNVLYTPPHKKTRRRPGVLAYLAEELEHGEINCELCNLRARVIVANKISVHQPHGLRHLKNLLKES